MSLKIGQVAERAGVSDEGTVERIKLIKQLQDLSLTLEEVDAMLIAVADDRATCARESSRIAMALGRTEERLASLEAVRDKRREALGRCGRGECDLVERARKAAPSVPAGARRATKAVRK